jgi:competence ComEA-like helix-hairpin-helix protein
MDINKASAEELEQAFEVDGTRARYLVDYRNKNGGFRSWDDVKKVPGFEDKMVENLRTAGLTLSGADSHSQQKLSNTRGSDAQARREGEGNETRGGFDVNTASPEQLQSVAQIDGERASYFIEARRRVGRFESWEQIKREAPSFEDGMIERLKQAGARLG